MKLINLLEDPEATHIHYGSYPDDMKTIVIGDKLSIDTQDVKPLVSIAQCVAISYLLKSTKVLLNFEDCEIDQVVKDVSILLSRFGADKMYCNK
jgi:hypothetical protein